MRLVILIFSVFLLSFPSYSSDRLIDKSKKAIAELQKNLKSELQNAMREGGPKNALKVCNIKAPKINKSVSADTKVKIKRVALKYRNPDNKPDEWEKSALEEFINKKNSGENIHNLEAVKNAEDYFRYMKAIPMGGVCAACHGTNVSKPLKADILKLYPNDKATGFKPGDIRGAFSVKIKKPFID